ncbi:Alcohol dehydrogenase [acceptor] [bacterium HR40]|nr:Alcohol dehydrogenase [acceptor] [bacterium HR40]
MPAATETFDYIIVGAGTAGCVLANRLTADGRHRVLLLEAGGRDSWIWIHVPIGYLYTQNHPRTDWCFRTEPEPALGGRSLAYPRGRVIGGCSSINGMIYMRGQARDYDLWRQMGNPGWSWQEVLPYFRRSEDFFRGADDWHGAGGEWRVEESRVRWDILDAFREAAAECGIPKVDDFNRGDNEGCGYFHVNQKRGVRWSAAKAFLRPALERRNLELRLHCLTRRLLLAGRRIVGVEYERGGEIQRVRANIEVILAAGAINSPHLLQLSGIGPGRLLREFGIEVRHELAGVGENLQDHLQIRPVWRVKNARTLNELSHSLLGRVGIGLEYLLFRSGPLSMAPSTLGAFARSGPEFDTPNLEYHVQPLSLDRFGEPLHPFPAITPSVCNLRPTSRGWVRLASTDPHEPPRIRPNYLSTPEDRKVAADALRLTRRIMAARAMARFEPSEYRPGAEVQSEDELADAAGRIATTIFHPVGTCRMGPAEDRGSVVDCRLKVHGLAGLRIVDASVMPIITSGNTCSPVIMIAEKAADMILEDARMGASAAA